MHGHKKIQQKNLLTKSFIALSLSSLFVTALPADVQKIDNINDPDKKQEIGNATSPDTLKGGISTTGNNAKTTVTFNGSSKMGDGTIAAQIKAQNGNVGVQANTGAKNEVIFKDKSTFALTEGDQGNIAGGGGGGGGGQQANPADPKDDAKFSILADGNNASNNISDLTDGSGAKTIAGGIIAKNSGKNTLFNIKNTTITGPIIASGSQSKNTITLDDKTTFKSYILAKNGGENDITLNQNAHFEMEDAKAEQTAKASIYAYGENSKNTIKGTTTAQNNVSSKILAKQKGKNEITLDNLKVTSDVSAEAGGENKITIKTGELQNITTLGKDSRNEILLTTNAVIKGYIQNNESNNDTEGSNKITLEGASSLDLHNGTQANKQGTGTGNNGSAIFTSKNARNEIDGASTGEHKISGNITAKSGGENKITLDALTMTGDIVSEGGKNTIKLGNFGKPDKKTTLTGNIKADHQGANQAPQQQPPAPKADPKDGINDIDFTNLTMTGNVEAQNEGKNHLRFKNAVITGDIEAKNKGQNTLELGNGGTKAEIKKDTNNGKNVSGKISASANGKNIIEFNNGDVEGGIIATGGQNDITLGNATYRGTTKANIDAENSGVNFINVQSASHTGSITAKGGKNFILDDSPQQLATTITGKIAANDKGQNSIVLKNITITEGVTANGEESVNLMTLGEKPNGIITSNFLSENKGLNLAILKDNASIVGNFEAKTGGSNILYDDEKLTTRTNITGEILADGGKNYAIMSDAEITGGFHAKNSGENLLTIADERQPKKERKVIAKLHAEDGGKNTAIVGHTAQKVKGELSGELLAEGGGSSNEVTLNDASVLSNSRIYAKARKPDAQGQNQNNANNQQTVNTVTINDTSKISLFGQRNENFLVQYAIYAHGTHAKNKITDNSDETDNIEGDIVADNTDALKNVPDPKPAPAPNQIDHATNELAFKNLVLKGEVDAYNGGENKITFHKTNSQTGDILAQTSGKNHITLKTTANTNPPAQPATSHTIDGQITADQGGENTILLEKDTTLTVKAQGNENAIRADKRGSKNVIKEHEDVANAGAAPAAPVPAVPANPKDATEPKIDTTAVINGKIRAEEHGENEIVVKYLQTDGDISALGGKNTITFGGAAKNPPDPKTQRVNATVIADSANITDAKDSTNTLNLFGSANFSGSLQAKGTTTEKTAKNFVAMKGDSNVTLTGRDDIVGADGQKLGADNDGVAKSQKIAILSTGLKSYNKITDETSGKVKSTITGNIYAETNAQNNQELSGNEVTLKNIEMTGNIIAQNQGQNKITFGQDNAGNNPPDPKNGTMDGNITARVQGKNEINFTNIDFNTKKKWILVRAVSNAQGANETSNKITLNKKSKIVETAILALQEVTAENNTTIGDTKNEITIKDESLIDISGAQEGTSSILASGLKTQNIIKDETQVKQIIKGNIQVVRGGKNTIQLNHAEIAGDFLANGRANENKFPKGQGADNSKNDITIGSDAKNPPPPPPNPKESTLKGKILAENYGENEIKIFNAEYDNGEIRTTEHAKNNVEMTNVNFKSGGVFATGGDNNVKFKSKYDLKITGKNNLSVGNSAGKIKIEDEDAADKYKAKDANDDNSFSGDVLATARGTTEISLNRLVLKGNITAREKGSKNTIKLGKSGNKTSITGNVEADEGENVLEIKFGEHSGHFFAHGKASAKNDVKLISSKITNSHIIALNDLDGDEDAQQPPAGIQNTDAFENTIALSDATPQPQPPADPKNAPSIVLTAHNQNAIFAKGKRAHNTIKDDSKGEAQSQITGAINAINEAKNDITLKNVNMTGDIKATEKATNTVTFGRADPKPPPPAQKNTLKGDVIATAGTNSVTLDHFEMTGSVIAIVDDSKNTVDLKNSELKDGRLIAISEEKESKNELKIDANTKISLVGKQVHGAGGEALGSGKDAIYTDGEKSKNIITDNNAQNNQHHSITGDITAHNGATNSYDFKHINIVGSLRATANKSTNTIILQNSSDIKTGEMYADGIGVSNDLTLKTSAKAEEYMMRAISGGVDPEATQNAAKSGAKNTLKIEENATFKFSTKNKDGIVMLARGKDAKNAVSSEGKQPPADTGEGTITGRIVAENGGENEIKSIKKLVIESNIAAVGGKAKNTIIVGKEAGNSFKANATNSGGNFAILARDGENKIEITNNAHEIKGDIVSENEGKNDVKFEVDPKNQNGGNQNGANDKKLEIFGNIISNHGGSTNTITLAGGSKIEATFIKADGGQNNITITDGHFKISGVHPYGVFASNSGKNIFTQDSKTESQIENNIIAHSGGENTITAVHKISISKAFVEAKGNGSKNSITLKKESKLNLQASGAGNALLAADNGKNTIEDSEKTTNKNEIKGRVLAVSGGQNDVTLTNVKVLGDMISRESGKNVITLGGENEAKTRRRRAAPVQNPGLDLGFVGAIKAFGDNSQNILDLKKDAEAIVQKNSDDNTAVFSSGQSASNEIKDDNSGKTLKIMGDVLAQNGANNKILHKDTQIEGDVIAKNGGVNEITVEKLTVSKIQSVKTEGIGSLNILNYNASKFDTGVLIAQDFGENRVFVTYDQQKNANQQNGYDFDITTRANAKNTLIMQNVKSVNTQILYEGGETTVVLAESKSTAQNTGGIISESTYNDGVMLVPNSHRANEILKDFRNFNIYASNLTRFRMEDKNNYNIGGIYVGTINFLKSSQAQKPPVTTEANLKIKPDGALIASIYDNANASLNLTLGERTKWVVIPTEASGTTIHKITAENAVRDPEANTEGHNSTLANRNTTIDLATGGVHVRHGVKKNQFFTLTISEAAKLNHVTFRIYADTTRKMADVIKVDKANNNGSETKTAILEAYHEGESLKAKHRNRYKYVDLGGRLNTNNTLVAKIGKDAKSHFAFDISKPTRVKQGFLQVTTSFVKKTENADGTTTGNNNDQVDNYYINGISAELDKNDIDHSYNIASVNYTIFLSHLSDMNRRLGDLRNETHNHGIWTNFSGGTMHQNLGEHFRNAYFSHQGGYDLGFPTENGMQFAGFALGYGINSIKSPKISLKAMNFSGSTYYSYVNDEGLYLDSVLRYDRINTTPVDSNFTTSLVTNAFSLSQEIGYHKKLGDNFFIETRALGLAGNLGGLDATQSEDPERLDAQLDINFSRTFVLRALGGGSLGYRFKTENTETDISAGFTYIFDYNATKAKFSVKEIADAERTYGTNEMKILNFNANSRINQDLRLFGGVDIGLGNDAKIYRGFAVNGGVRYAFGGEAREPEKKVDDGQNKIEKEKPAQKPEPKDDFPVIKISAKTDKKNGSEPESGLYVKMLSLGAPHPGLNAYFAKLGFRIHKEQNGSVTYYLGAYDSDEKAKKIADFGSKILQALTKKQDAKASIFRIQNDAK